MLLFCAVFLFYNYLSNVIVLLVHLLVLLVWIESSLSGVHLT